MPKIFISYRRVDFSERTHRIADWLTLKYGKSNVFIDVDRLGGGVDFKDVLEENLKRTDVLLVIIGSAWVSELENRIEDRKIGKDFVFLEVVQGIEKDIKLIIPVHLDNTPNIRESDLPDEIHELTTRNYARVRANPDFHKDMEKINEEINKLFWYERVIRYGLGLIAILLIALMIFTGLIATGIIRQEVTGTATSTPNPETEIPLTWTQEALDLQATEDAPDLTATFVSVFETLVADSTATALANVALTEAQFTSTPTITATTTVTSTPTSTLTITPDLSATIGAQQTGTADAQEALDEIATQNAQGTANAPTNTPQPTVTATATVTNTATSTPTVTQTSTNTPTVTPTVDLTGTAVVALNETETQIAVATQIFATAQARVIVGRVDIIEPLNLRSSANSNSVRVAEAQPGEVLVILDRNEDESWLQVELPTGENGWVSGAYFGVLGSYPASELERIQEELRLILSESDWEPIVREFDDVPMVLVPAGCFRFGITDREISTLQALDSFNLDMSLEQPNSNVCLEYPFWIDQFEVSQGQFAEIGGVAEQVSEFEGDDLPVANINWEESQAYCELRGGYLPSEVQWEYAARGVSSNVFPWGDRFEFDTYNWNRTNDVDETDAVDLYPDGISWVGAYQMQGNVSEWTLSASYSYPNPSRNFVYLEDFEDLDNENRLNPIVRGSSFFDGWQANARNSRRLVGRYQVPENDLGLRCVRNYD